jgi:proline iminopeptidase
MFTSYFEIEEDTRIFFKVYGSRTDIDKLIDHTQPTLIFLHGGPGVVDHSIYEPFWSTFSELELFDSNLQVIFLDHRGCGRSFYDRNGIHDYGDSSKWNLMQWGKDVHAFFTGLNIVKPIIAGVSFGGVVAMSCATQFPTELGGLILCDTDACFNLDEVISHFFTKAKNQGLSDFEAKKVSNAARAMFTNTTAQTYAEYLHICAPYCAKNPYNADLISRCVKNEASAFIYNRNELTTYNFLPLLSQIECQTLVFSGGQNPVHTPESALRTVSALNPEKVVYKIFLAAGSPVYADHADEVTFLIKNYLSNLSYTLTTRSNYVRL